MEKNYYQTLKDEELRFVTDPTIKQFQSKISGIYATKVPIALTDTEFIYDEGTEEIIKGYKEELINYVRENYSELFVKNLK